MELNSELGLRNAATCVQVTDRPDLSLAEFGPPVLNATTISLAPLHAAVSVVVAACSEEQVARSYTRRIVAAMEDAQSIGNGAEDEVPSNAVRDSRPPVKIQQSVGQQPRSLLAARLPLPATIAHGDFLPEPINHRTRMTFVDSSGHRLQFNIFD